MSLPPHFRPLRPRLSVTKRPAEKGQVFIESAIITIPLMFLIFGLIDTSLALWVRATLEHAAREGARYAITYRLQPGMRHDASIKHVVKRHAMGLVNDSDISITYYNGDITTGDLLTPLPANAGNRPDNVVVIRVRRNWIWIVRSLMSASPSVLEGTSADRMESLGAGQNPPPRI